MRMEWSVERPVLADCVDCDNFRVIEVPDFTGSEFVPCYCLGRHPDPALVAALVAQAKAAKR